MYWYSSTDGEAPNLEPESAGSKCENFVVHSLCLRRFFFFSVHVRAGSSDLCGTGYNRKKNSSSRKWNTLVLLRLSVVVSHFGSREAPVSVVSGVFSRFDTASPIT